MRVKVKEPKKYYKDGKVFVKETYFIMHDDFGDILRKSESKFPNSKETIQKKIVLDLDDCDEALF